MSSSGNPSGLHVAIVMDGNGRWASKRFLPRLAGHKQGVEALKRIVRACPSRGIAALTVFAFSSENWSRPADEVSGLMDILVGALTREVAQLSAEGVRIRFVGSRTGLSEKVQHGLNQAELDTIGNTSLDLNICFNYGGRWDIVQAANTLVARGAAITEQTLGEAMALAPSTDPDLLIRTGGEFRISNFLLWQSAYSELIFSPKLWPDYAEADLDAALEEFASRERRFGKTSAQIA
jgi:undecaprenyl diphosphate synthase